MSAVGGDLATLSDLYNKFTDAAAQTEQLTSTVDGSVNAAVWTGQNADSFRTSWAGFRQSLKQIQEALLQGGTDVRNQHNNIAMATGSAERI